VTSRRKSVAEFDARPVLVAGDEPFEAILAAVSALEPGEPLVVYAPFEPVPLEGVLGAQGFAFSAEQLGPDDWKVTFTPSS
jgi:uncharacterized protein (DUF2249 family)